MFKQFMDERWISHGQQFIDRDEKIKEMLQRHKLLSNDETTLTAQFQNTVSTIFQQMKLST